MSILDTLILGGIVFMFVAFLAALAWGSWQTRNLPVPRDTLKKRL